MRYFQCLFVLIVVLQLSEQTVVENRIVNGERVSIEDYPYQVYLRLNNYMKNHPPFACGGSIISKHYILTAGHCVTKPIINNEKSWILAAADQIDVIAGQDKKRMFKKSRKFKVKEIILHKDFDAKYNFDPQGNFQGGGPTKPDDADIALLHLTKPLTFSNKIAKIRLPSLEETDDSSYTGQIGVASGWGLMAYNKEPFFLQAVKVKIPEYRSAELVNKFSFPVLNDRRSTCSGDSGGPLAIRSDDPKTAVQYGISSSVFFLTPEQECHRLGLMTFVNVVYYRKWILNKTNIGDDHEDNEDYDY